ncbi:MAG: DUF4351 domain-containing protein, partial [Candidatus Sericytochromatia bacterium]|nr:DUF4351 domain-containing protein [Candidatus Sericytochromatia bacterium]
EVPTASPARVVETAIVDAVPVEWRADLVVTLGEPVARIVVLELQLRRDEGKRWAWPVYVSVIQARHQVPTNLVVLAPDPNVAAWARNPLPMGDMGSITPFVVGPSELPPIAVPEAAAANPPLAVLAAAAHCREPADIPALALALEALQALPAPSVLRYTKALEAALARAFQALPEVQMTLRPFFKYPTVEAYLDAVRAESRAEGRSEGQAEARQQEALRFVLRMLGRRIGLPGAEGQAQLEGLTTEQLEDLGEALLDFRQPEDLTAWLKALPKTRKGRRRQG